MPILTVLSIILHVWLIQITQQEYYAGVFLKVTTKEVKQFIESCIIVSTY